MQSRGTIAHESSARKPGVRAGEKIGSLRDRIPLPDSAATAHLNTSSPESMNISDP